MSPDAFKKTLQAHGAATVAVWSLLILLLAALTLHLEHLSTIKSAESEARNYFDLNRAYRAWAARMGGLYVDVRRVAPNPYLPADRRDRSTTRDEQLTLVNPAYMTRMVFDAIREAQPIPIVSKITSLKPLNPNNAPDPWEAEALRSFERGERKARTQLTELNGEPYLRFISLFLTEQPCLDCHRQQGYRLGEVRGGITISIPMRGYLAAERQSRQNLMAGYLLLWGVGSGGIVVSARRRSAYQDRLRAGEEKFRTICDWTQDWECWLDPHGGFKYMSPSCLEHTGYTREEFLEDPDLVRRLVHAEDVALFSGHLWPAQPVEPQGDGSIEFRIRTREGKLRWLHLVSRPVFSGCQYLGHRLSIRDVTERKQAEQSLEQTAALLKENEGKLRVIFDVMQAGLIQVDRSGVVTFANQRMAEMLGLTRDELIGSQYCYHVWPEQREEARLSLQRLLAGEVAACNLERRFRRKDGSAFWGYLSGRSLEVTERSGTSLVATVADMTELKSAEEERLKSEQQMLHVQKLESLGVLAGGIAHDFNNILLAIMGNVSLALLRDTPGSAVGPHLHQIELAAEKAADLARQMLAYSGKGRFVLQPVDLNQLVREMTVMLEVSISKKAELRFQLAPDLPCIVADPTQIRQIVMNLAINASEAVGEGNGVISITTGSRYCDRDYLAAMTVCEQLTEGVYLYLEVADNGCGMDHDTMARIFEPFFTTKFTGRGLGMSAIQGIVRGHKGAIRVYSEPGQGSSFRVYFPSSERRAEPERQAPDRDRWRGQGTVLLVDDEESVRSVGSAMLSELGFTVLTAVNGEEALRMYPLRKEEIRLVVMDLNMPHLNGEEAFLQLRAIDPGVRVVLSSGFNEQEVTRNLLDKGLSGFVQKPYTMATLTEVLSRLF